MRRAETGWLALGELARLKAELLPLRRLPAASAGQIAVDFHGLATDSGKVETNSPLPFG